jgi:cystathionine beta-lyase
MVPFHLTINRYQQLYFVVNATGVGLAPFECFLLMRGIKTLSVRLEQQQRSAMKIATFLEICGFRVRYPGLLSHPQFELHAKMARGAGAVLSFETGDVVKSEKIVEAARLWLISVSFGCVNSLIRYLIISFLFPLACLVECHTPPYQLKYEKLVNYQKI